MIQNMNGADVDHIPPSHLKGGESGQVKVCTKCGEARPISGGFHKGQSRCIECKKKDRRKRYQPEEQKIRSWKSALWTRFGMTPFDYYAMLDEQFGVCAICHKTDRRKLCVDHCHETGKVRGLLCHSCNVAIGLMKDDAERCASAASYLSA